MDDDMTYLDWVEGIQEAANAVEAELELCEQLGCPNPGFCDACLSAVDFLELQVCGLMEWQETRSRAHLN
jgi:hypothetical protein